MLKQLAFVFSFALLSGSFILPTAANAQVSAEDPDDAIYHGANVISNTTFHTEFVRLPGAKEGDLTIRISSPGSVSGCLKMTQSSFESKSTGTTLKIELKPHRINIDEDTQYGLHRCKVSTASASADFTITRDELIANGTKKINISADSVGAFMRIKVDEIDQDKVLLTANPMDLARMGQDFLNEANKTTYWFYPDNTVILFNPTLDIDGDVSKKVAKLSMVRGLQPLNSVLDGFKSTEENEDILYFVDEHNIYAKQLAEPSGVTTIGEIEIAETYHGANGPYEKPIRKPIFARKPALTE